MTSRPGGGKQFAEWLVPMPKKASSACFNSQVKHRSNFHKITYWKILYVPHEPIGRICVRCLKELD